MGGDRPHVRRRTFELYYYLVLAGLTIGSTITEGPLRGALLLVVLVLGIGGVCVWLLGVRR